jgi:hypothetical protein
VALLRLADSHAVGRQKADPFCFCAWFVDSEWQVQAKLVRDTQGSR